MTTSEEEEQGPASRPRETETPVEQAVRDEEPFSVFTLGQKRAIIFTASVASLFSPLAANIYFPALNTLASDLHVSTNLINLTVTTYLVRHTKVLSSAPLLWFHTPN